MGKNALISVSNKEGLDYLLKTLKKFNYNIISSGGTFKYIRNLGYKCTEISKYTGFKEMLDGRVKTLHPAIHAAILARGNNSEDMTTLDELGYPRISVSCLSQSITRQGRVIDVSQVCTSNYLQRDTAIKCQSCQIFAIDRNLLFVHTAPPALHSLFLSVSTRMFSVSVLVLFLLVISSLVLEKGLPKWGRTGALSPLPIQGRNRH